MSCFFFYFYIFYSWECFLIDVLLNDLFYKFWCILMVCLIFGVGLMCYISECNCIYWFLKI